MGRAPCCEKDSVKRGPWTPEEDAKLLACIAQHGTGSWRTLPKKAGLQRCGKSCRLRWTNYLRPDLKHGRFTDHEEQLIVNLHAALGSRWSLIAAQLPGRTDNDVKNYWNTRLKKKLCEMGIDPITHKPISQLLADLAGSMALPKGGEIAEAALGCFKDDMLNVLMRKRPDWQLEGSGHGALPAAAHGMATGRQSWDMIAGPRAIPCVPQPNKPVNIAASAYNSTLSEPCNPRSMANQNLQVDAVVQKIKYSLSRAVQTKEMQIGGDIVKPRDEWMSQNMAVMSSRFYRGEGESPGNLPQLSNQIMLGEHIDAPLPKSILDLFLDPTLSSGGLNSCMGKLNSSLEKEAADFGKTRNPWAGTTSGGTHCNAPHLQLPFVADTPSYMFTNLLCNQQEHTSSRSHCQESPSNDTLVPTSCEMEPWSPSPSGSSCSSTSLAEGDVAGLEKVLSSDVFLWDFSELSSIMS